MTRYYVDFSTQLLKEMDPAKLPEGFRLVQRWGPRGWSFERWIVEDDNADDYYEDHLVELSLGASSNSDRAVILGRTVTYILEHLFE